MPDLEKQYFRGPWLWLIRVIGVLVPRRVYGRAVAAVAQMGGRDGPGHTLCGSNVSEESGLHPGGRVYAFAGDWRQHGHLYALQQPVAALADCGPRRDGQAGIPRDAERVGFLLLRLSLLPRPDSGLIWPGGMFRREIPAWKPDRSDRMGRGCGKVRLRQLLLGPRCQPHPRPHIHGG